MDERPAPEYSLLDPNRDAEVIRVTGSATCGKDVQVYMCVAEPQCAHAPAASDSEGSDRDPRSKRRDRMTRLMRRSRQE